MKQYRLGNTVWNKTEFTNNDGDTLFLSDRVEVKLTEQELIDMGAVPVDSELDEKRPTGDSTCEKCGERECEHEYHTTKHGYTFCTHCGKSEPKEEKIKEPNYPIGEFGGESKNLITTADFKRWVKQVTNKLNGDN